MVNILLAPAARQTRRGAAPPRRRARARGGALPFSRRTSQRPRISRANMVSLKKSASAARLRRHARRPPPPPQPGPRALRLGLVPRHRRRGAVERKSPEASRTRSSSISRRAARRVPTLAHEARLGLEPRERLAWVAAPTRGRSPSRTRALAQPQLRLAERPQPVDHRLHDVGGRAGGRASWPMRARLGERRLSDLRLRRPAGVVVLPSGRRCRRTRRSRAGLPCAPARVAAARGRGSSDEPVRGATRATVSRCAPSHGRRTTQRTGTRSHPEPRPRRLDVFARIRRIGPTRRARVVRRARAATPSASAEPGKDVAHVAALHAAGAGGASARRALQPASSSLHPSRRGRHDPRRWRAPNASGTARPAPRVRGGP